MNTNSPSPLRHWGSPTSPAKPNWRLVCFAHAGGSASFFSSWAQHLPANVELIAVQYPGRGDRIADPLIDCMPTLVSEIVAALHTLSGPLVLFGHSLGASVAHEVARALNSDNVAALCVSGQPAPRHHRGGQLHAASEEELCLELANLGASSKELLDNPELRALMLPIIRNDYRLTEKNYVPAPASRLNCPILALCGELDPEARIEEVSAWENYTGERFSLQVFPGEHFFIIPQQKQVVQTIAHFVRDAVAAAQWPLTP